MGFDFKKLFGSRKLKKAIDQVADVVGDALKNSADKDRQSVASADNSEDIILAPGCHTAVDWAYGRDRSKYKVSFNINDAFKETKSHAAEVEMLHVYAPGDADGEEGDVPYIAMEVDDKIYDAVSEFKEKGSFKGAKELTSLSGKFYFKAKMEYFGYIMYFYGTDRCEGYMENTGLCLVYPKSYAGTEKEAKLIAVLDEAAKSYSEIRVE